MLPALLSAFISLAAQIAACDSATIIFAGDAMQHQSQIDAAKRTPATFDYNECFANVKPLISAADYAVINLETPLGGSPYSGYPMFCAPDQYLDALVDAGFDLFLTANNHALDRSDKGVRRTIAQLERRNLSHIGTYANPAQRDSLLPVIVDINGFRVGFVNYTYCTNGLSPHDGSVVDQIDFNLMQTDIANARKQGAELIAACLHWGEEYHLKESASQRRLAQRLADIGVEMVIGSHPHVVQPMTYIQGLNQHRKTFVVYSLGNFISGMKTADTSGGSVVKLTLRRDSHGRAYVDENAERKLVFTITPSHSGENFRLIDADSVITSNPKADEQRLLFKSHLENIN